MYHLEIIFSKTESYFLLLQDKDVILVLEYQMIFLSNIMDKDQELEIIQDGYVSPIPPELQWQSWAADDEGMTGDALRNFIDQQLFPVTFQQILGAGHGFRGTEEGYFHRLAPSINCYIVTVYILCLYPVTNEYSLIPLDVER